jgi:hypothetical protein
MYEELDELFEDQLRGDESFDADGMGDGGVMSTEDGCNVEPDGHCSHGQPSPALRLGIM